MLAGITPSVEMTGGPWFTDNELDTEFVAMLKKIAYKYLRDHVGLLPLPFRLPSSLLLTPAPYSRSPT